MTVLEVLQFRFIKQYFSLCKSLRKEYIVHSNRWIPKLENYLKTEILFSLPAENCFTVLAIYLALFIMWSDKKKKKMVCPIGIQFDE